VILEEVKNLFVINLQKWAVHKVSFRQLTKKWENRSGNDASMILVGLQIINERWLMSKANIHWIFPIASEHGVCLALIKWLNTAACLSIGHNCGIVTLQCFSNAGCNVWEQLCLWSSLVKDSFIFLFEDVGGLFDHYELLLNLYLELLVLFLW